MQAAKSRASSRACGSGPRPRYAANAPAARREASSWACEGSSGSATARTALGGTGGGIAYNREEFVEIVKLDPKDSEEGEFLGELQVSPDMVNPAYVFDTGYAAWQEMYPGEQKDIKEDREKIIELLQQDRNVYLHAMQNWNIERIERLRSAGWRKVQQA